MTALSLARPGLLLGERPEHTPPRQSWLAEQDRHVQHTLKRLRYRSYARFGQVSQKIEYVANDLARLNDGALKEFAKHLQQRLHHDGPTEHLCTQSFALIRLATERTLGFRLYDEQLFGGWLQLNGLLAEMETGEGKTLTAALPACTIALAGSPVHVITANDYLVTRDAETLTPVYEALNLSVGSVTESSDTEARRAAYRCDVTYVSNKQIVFDYLRDQQSLSGTTGSLRDRLSPLLNKPANTPVMRGLCFAIVDEADSVLIDDARTPLVLSQPHTAPMPSTNYAVGLGLARRLTQGEHYVVVDSERAVNLTPHGEERLHEMTQALTGSWTNGRYRIELVIRALTALHVFTRGDDYFVRDSKVILIDENTGRPMPDRKLSHGLHQMVETKEGCAVTGQMETLGSTSYQRFFRRYFHLAGMTGTASEVAAELERVYGLAVVKVPLHRASRRTLRRLSLHDSSEAKYRAILNQVAEEHSTGRPILVGTRTVAESEYLSTLLTDAGLTNWVLNARQDGDEAKLMAQAGERSSIVVATNMAGRGTDIPLGERIAELGGLHVISTQLNDAGRIDRQLVGRCARQGDPGSYQAIVSLDDPLICDFYPDSVRSVLARVASHSPFVWNRLAPVIARIPQWTQERTHYRARRAVLRHDEDLEDLLAFSGFGR
jgi:preprotein translocase subunit SecA